MADYTDPGLAIKELVANVKARMAGQDQALATARTDLAAADQALAVQINDAKTAAATAKASADKATADAAALAGKPKVQAQTAAPTDNTVLWIDTTDGANTPKVWTGTAWTAVDDADIVAASQAAVKAQTDATAADVAADAAMAAASKTTVDLATAEAALKAMDAQILSKGTDLIINGTGNLGNNTNFSGWAVSKTDVPTGSTLAFVSPKGIQGSKLMVDQKIPYDPTKAYRFKFDVKQLGTSTTSKFYAFFEPLDAFGQTIPPHYYCWQPGTQTTLAADLNPGDSTVKLTSAANWFGSTAKPIVQTEQAGLQFWDYVDGNGRAWAPREYTSNIWWDPAKGKWTTGGVNTATNTITLTAPYDGPAKKAGTPVSQSRPGGTYVYMVGASFADIPSQWTTLSSVYPAAGSMIRPEGTPAAFGSGPGGSSIPLPVATTQIRVGFLTNYPPDVANSQMAVAGVSLSDAAAAQTMANAKLDKPTGKTGQLVYNATTDTWEAAPSGSGVSYAIRGGSGIDVTEVTETDGSKTLVISLAAGA